MQLYIQWHAGGNGKLSKRPGITWSDAPVAVTFSKPYAVAVLPGHIEASSLLSITQNHHSHVNSPHGSKQ